AGRAGAAHVVALGAVGRCNEFAQRERKIRDVIPDVHRTSPCPSDVPSDLRTLLAFSRESSVNAILIFGPGSTSTVAESRLSPGLSATGRKLLRHVLFPTQLFRADAVRVISGFHIVS